MKSLSRVGLGLSVVFGCLFFALVCEIYYLLWWKRRTTGRRLEDDYYTNTGADFFYLSCWKMKNKKKKTRTRHSSLRSTTNLNSQEVSDENGFHFQANNGLFPKPFDENGIVETGLMVGPPRFLFTITEETKEDLESENGKSKGEGRRLSDLMVNGGTPYMTPLSSPAFFTPPVTPSVGSSHSRNSSNGYNPFYESSTDVEFSKMMRSSSPPPMFKFLRDAEEKLQRKNNTTTMATSKKDIVIRQQRQVLPLASSPLSLESSIFELSLAV